MLCWFLDFGDTEFKDRTYTEPPCLSDAELNKTRVVRKSNWLEQMREKKEQRQPSALQKQAAEAHFAAGRHESNAAGQSVIPWKLALPQ